MHEHDPQHPLAQIRIELQRRSHEVVQRRDRFYARKTAAGDHKSKQGLPVAEGTFRICLFETADDSGAKLDCIRK